MIRAIDVSAWQGVIDWAAVARSGVQAAWVRVGNADTTPRTADRRAPENLRAGDAAGVAMGTYYFAYPRLGEAAAQARHAVSCGLGTGQLWPALDLETHNGLSGADLDRFALDFCAEVFSLTGRTCVIYTGAWIGRDSNNLFGHNPANYGSLSKYPLWIANYGANHPGTSPPVVVPPIPPAWPEWSMWQFNASTPQPGVAGVVDQDVVTDAFWSTMTASSPTTTVPQEWRMRTVMVPNQQTQWRLVDDGFGVLRRQPLDSMDLVNILRDVGVTTGDTLVLTKQSEIDRFLAIPETGQVSAELGAIRLAGNIGAEIHKVAAETSAGGGTVDTVALADQLAREIAEHVQIRLTADG